ncbi:methyltransferase family protein [Catalinimonas niigatensis]|uniref:methyltransferase family protein n=1 Tax=Catalinimonas niigatensis TaxID=1397264 RepID=UPI002AA2A97B|nr:isoprenylcysteine carboxylmethyltransferase family protein [Catalinimonas niigatensis]WPP51659.1 isoprenylcysteine carboxylmethyltransferase family protein [Catalinimonas niigatensis]
MIILRHLISLILPVMVLIVVPYLIENDLHLTWLWTTILGSVFICFGSLTVILTIRMFIKIGNGTLAPWDPTRYLVTSSLYGYVRNPMIMGVFIVVLGEAILFASLSIGIWAFAFFVINTMYFIFSEEPGLEKRFGKEYIEYKKNVPRWIPRMKPWAPDHKRNNIYKEKAAANSKYK